MAQTLIRGTTQILPGSIPASAFVSGLALPTAQLQQGALFIQSSGTVNMAASLNMGGFTVINSTTPVNATDLATKSYVDSLANGLNFKNSAVALAAANITLNGLQTIDGVSLVANNRVLLIGQTTTTQNGIWLVQSGAWTRSTDWASGSVQGLGAYLIIDSSGTTYKNTKWFCTNTSPPTVDTTATTWIQDATGSSYSAGAGVSLTGSTFAAKAGAGLGFDGSNNLQVATAAGGLLTATGSGVGITASTTSAQMIVSNASNQPVWVSSSGDVTVSSLGAFTVNNVAGTGFMKYTNYIANETPGGAVNGTNTAFTMANTPQVNSLSLYLNGQMLEPGTGNDYTISGTALTMLFAPLSGDKLRGYYLK